MSRRIRAQFHISLLSALRAEVKNTRQCYLCLPTTHPRLFKTRDLKMAPNLGATVTQQMSSLSIDNKTFLRLHLWSSSV